MKSSTMAGGSSDKFGRNAADFYPTPRECTEALDREFPLLFRERIVWEPACGTGEMANDISDLGASTVVSTDLHHRGFGVGGIDFLTAPLLPGVEVIITNPPFNIAADFIERAAVFGIPFAMLLKGTYWHAAGRMELFRRTGPMAVLPMTWRPAFAPNRGKSPTMEFCWTVWGKKPCTETQYRPIGRP